MKWLIVKKKRDSEDEIEVDANESNSSTSNNDKKRQEENNDVAENAITTQKDNDGDENTCSNNSNNKVNGKMDDEETSMITTATATTSITDSVQPERPSLWKSLWRNSITGSNRNSSTATTSADTSSDTDNTKKTSVRVIGEIEEVEVEIDSPRTVNVHDNPRIINVHNAPQHDKKEQSTTTMSRTFLSQKQEYYYDRPSIYEESLEMLTASLLIYVFADLREMARQNKIQSKDLLQDTITISQVIDAMQQHQELLKQQAIEHEVIHKKLVQLQQQNQHHHHQCQSIGGNNDDKNNIRIEEILQGDTAANFTTTSSLTTLSSSSSSSTTSSSFMSKQTKESVLQQFHDEKTTQGVVYGIAINHSRKRITIIFRGSVTQQDFLTDARSSQKRIANPIIALIEKNNKIISNDADDDTTMSSSNDNIPKAIGIHTGFHSYLFRKGKEGKQRLEHILEDAKNLLKENPGYRLYCTGHSLGGACATLCGFYAAIDDTIIQYNNGPVVVISIASPQVGHQTFCDSFHYLEKIKRLQHLRIANKEDMITHLPFLTIKATAMSPLISLIHGAGNLYQHCGIQLSLKSLVRISSNAAAAAAEEEEDKNSGRSNTSISIRSNNYNINNDTDEANDSSTLSKHCSLCHPKGKCSETSSYTEEFKRALESAKLLVESMRPVAKADFDTLTSHHSCKEYEARLMAAKDYLSTITLDQLYQDETVMGSIFAGAAASISS